MRKLNVREWQLVKTALRAQKDMCVAEIKEGERQGKRSIFTAGYIEREHDDLISKLQESATNKAIYFDLEHRKDEL